MPVKGRKETIGGLYNLSASIFSTSRPERRFAQRHAWYENRRANSLSYPFVHVNACSRFFILKTMNFWRNEACNHPIYNCLAESFDRIVLKY